MARALSTLRTFLSELKRRRVFRVAVAYAVIGWLLIEVADTIFPHLQLPGWTITLVIVLTILGFPVALILAWAFELTPDGIRRTAMIPAGGRVATDPGAAADRGGLGGGGAVAGGRYEVLERIGAGAMGIVHRARDTRLRRVVAVKFLPDSMSADRAATARFLQEARAAAALNHPNITTLHAIEEDEERPFLVMELVEGETLEARLARSGALPVDEAVAIAAQVAAGLAAAHAKGIVHRDIKPANVMIAGEGLVKVMDFGIAKVPGGAAVTMAGSTMGSAAYMSPEQVRGEEVDGRSDIWALGVVLYEMLCGRLPFPGDNQHTVLHGVLNVEPEPVTEARPDAPAWLAELTMRALAKDRRGRPGTASAMLGELRRGDPAVAGTVETAGIATAPPPRRRLAGRRFAVLATLAVAALLLPAAWFHTRDAAAQRARDVDIPELLALLDSHDCLQARIRAEALESVVPGDPQLQRVHTHCSIPTTILSDPPDADVYIRQYGDFDAEWYHLGRTPLEDHAVPVGLYHWRIEKPGFERVDQGMASWSAENFTYQLFPEGTAPEGMVRIPGTSVAVAGAQAQLGPYWLDRYEVTNSEFKEFVDAGGYRDASLWVEPFVQEGRELAWAEAMDRLRDAAGHPGPATWTLGEYPEGRSNHPVGGVSWYEAAAYCAWAGKDLPTVFHWKLGAGAAGGDALFSDIIWVSNLDGDGPAAVGSHPGISRYGAYDMAGNVKEWNRNPAGERRYILGGGWNEPLYMFNDLDAQVPFARSATFGFRCARFDEPPAEDVTGEVPISRPGGAQPVSDEILEALTRQYAYDPSPLNARHEGLDDTPPHWRRETVSIDAAYGGERIPIHLYFPRDVSPPYQAVLYYPSAAALRLRNSTAADANYVFFVPRSGRVLVHPVLKGLYERREETSGRQAMRDVFIQRVKDVGRTMDYLMTRDDIDPAAIAYFGLSLGASAGPHVTALDDRFRASILVGGGLVETLDMPEVSQHNFAPRVTLPTLMIGGRHDFMAPVDTRQRPLFELLGTPERDKALLLFEAGHVPNSNDVIRESNAWLDRYLGPVRR